MAIMVNVANYGVERAAGESLFWRGAAPAYHQGVARACSILTKETGNSTCLSIPTHGLPRRHDGISHPS